MSLICLHYNLGLTWFFHVPSVYWMAFRVPLRYIERYFTYSIVYQKASCLRNVPHYRGGGHIFHYWIVHTGRGGESTLSQAHRWPHHWWVHCSILFFGHEKGWESNLDKLHLGAKTKGHTIGTRQDSWSSITPPGLVTIDVLYSGVHETYSVWLEHCAI